MFLGKLETRAQRHVGGIERQERAAVSLQEITVGFAAEKMPVVVFRRHVAAIEIGRSQASPVQGGAQPPQQVSLNVLIEKFALEVGKDTVAMESVVSRRKAASRHGGDVVHFVQQSPALALPDDLGPCQLFQDAIRQGSGAG